MFVSSDQANIAHARNRRKLDGGSVFRAISRHQTEARGARGVKTIRTMLFVFSPGVVEPVPEVERVPLKKKTRAMSSASEAVKTPITVQAGSDRITISRSPRRGLTKLEIDEAQHSHDEVRSENHIHKRAPDAGAKAQLERMIAPEARTTLTR
ncbi:unnamed protein product [Trichogramma brassicae]|uniref:Uncharacterized protein n=1 Tax=Trichogramma brassicae TaxID=86971 RepID=A0A6H5IW08_9HYME|nr:unnamed protein product [Trichogramma brassicae]